MTKRFLDVGIAVRDLDAAVARYSRILGVPPRMLGGEHYAYPGLKGARLYIANATISLVASDHDHSPIAKFINSRGEGVNHISFEVTDIEQNMREMSGQGIVFVTPAPLPFPEGQVAFTHPRTSHGVQIAIVQPAPGVDLLNPPADQ